MFPQNDDGQTGITPTPRGAPRDPNGSFLNPLATQVSTTQNIGGGALGFDPINSAPAPQPTTPPAPPTGFYIPPQTAPQIFANQTAIRSGVPVSSGTQSNLSAAPSSPGQVALNQSVQFAAQTQSTNFGANTSSLENGPKAATGGVSGADPIGQSPPSAPVSESPEDLLRSLNLDNSRNSGGGLAILGKIPAIGSTLVKIPAKFIAIIGGGIFALLLIIVLANVLHQSPASVADASKVGSQLATTMDLVQYGQQANLSTIQSVNAIAESNVAIPSRQDDLNQYFGSIGKNQPDKSNLSETTTTNLANAVANSTLETEYKTELENQLSATYAALQKLAKDSGLSDDAKSAIAKAEQDVKAIYDRLDKE